MLGRHTQLVTANSLIITLTILRVCVCVQWTRCCVVLCAVSVIVGN